MEHSDLTTINMSAIDIYKEVLSGKRKKFPDGFWIQPEAKNNATECIKYLLDEILQWDSNDIKTKLVKKVFMRHKLSGMLQLVFNDSTYKAIKTTYPNRFLPWELVQVSKNTWTNEMGITATKWLIEDFLKWTKEDIKNKLNIYVFYNNGLGGMLHTLYNGSPYEAISALYPGCFKPWNMSMSPNGSIKIKERMVKSMYDIHFEQFDGGVWIVTNYNGNEWSGIAIYNSRKEAENYILEQN